MKDKILHHGESFADNLEVTHMTKVLCCVWPVIVKEVLNKYIVVVFINYKALSAHGQNVHLEQLVGPFKFNTLHLNIL
ncbi:hypothetical protein BGW38_003926 [Lunasporangiospora selenospora]|uniref:Uncharacterized protein n=1 Tax=Lunasporangiospora selenospora TaxID=979761 RepID=A0A9P6FR69_9FUNG|nr:hypothetical protein BGW38_003926 [Lunasporangiospora selenospora]